MIGESQISVLHSPIPWWPRPIIDRLRTDGVFARTRISKQNNEGGTSTTITAEVIALVDGTEVILMQNLTDVDVAYDIAHQIRRLMACPSREP